MWLTLGLIPAGAGLGALKMNVFTVFVIGAWVLVLLVAVANHEWKRTWLRLITQNAYIQWAVVAITFVATGWIACAVHRPALTDPEAAENKYVHKRWVSPPDGKEFTRAFLVEFGVNKLNTVGVAIGVQFNGDSFDFWYGEPNRTDRQQQNVTGWDRSELYPGEILWLRHPDFQITPQRSLYVCILSHDHEMKEPNDVMYLAVQLNETKGPPTKTRLGHQYSFK